MLSAVSEVPSTPAGGQLGGGCGSEGAAWGSGTLGSVPGGAPPTSSSVGTRLWPLRSRTICGREERSRGPASGVA